ncbi:hypothetical protein [Deinococcus roseus]|uniref:Uncharacterized protein n=1 Tax=Deinococcus roseus TaxID=392414 RepID=A0ABQ2CVI1_9DEIO|nr:hypothetical protein [Deinococcus roseus]GGJ24850.1 hypothetical protein GCM10008938_08720 [Deinococcus roseus]
MKKKAMIIAALLGVAAIGPATSIAFAQTVTASEQSGLSGFQVIDILVKATSIGKLSDAQLRSLVPPREKGAQALYDLILIKTCLQQTTLDNLITLGDEKATNLLVAKAAVEFRTCKPVNDAALAADLNSGKFDFSNAGSLQAFLVSSGNSAIVRDLLNGVTPTK